jgi:hypothetical protein
MLRKLLSVPLRVTDYTTDLAADWGSNPELIISSDKELSFTSANLQRTFMERKLVSIG